ncbi:MAG: hypothetical protein AAGA90_09355 [Actinomycetota bacterium]
MTRESLLPHLTATAALTSSNQNSTIAFARRVEDWLNDVEGTLARLRLPLISLVAAQRGALQATDDGYLPARAPDGTSKRKAQRLAATHALAIVEEAIRDEVAAADARMLEHAQLLTRLVARAATAAPPIPPAAGQDPVEWERAVWAWLDQVEDHEVQLMRTLAATSMAASDRSYLFQQLHQNVVAAG